MKVDVIGEFKFMWEFGLLLCEWLFEFLDWWFDLGWEDWFLGCDGDCLLLLVILKKDVVVFFLIEGEEGRWDKVFMVFLKSEGCSFVELGGDFNLILFLIYFIVIVCLGFLISGLLIVVVEIYCWEGWCFGVWEVEVECVDWFVGCFFGFSSFMGWGVKFGLVLYVVFLVFLDVCESDVLVWGDDMEWMGIGELVVVVNWLWEVVVLSFGLCSCLVVVLGFRDFCEGDVCIELDCGIGSLDVDVVWLGIGILESLGMLVGLVCCGFFMVRCVWCCWNLEFVWLLGWVLEKLMVGMMG